MLDLIIEPTFKIKVNIYYFILRCLSKFKLYLFFFLNCNDDNQYNFIFTQDFINT